MWLPQLINVRFVSALGHVFDAPRVLRVKTFDTSLLRAQAATGRPSFRLDCKQVLNDSVVVTRQQPLPSAAERSRDGKGLVPARAGAHARTHAHICAERAVLVGRGRGE